MGSVSKGWKTGKNWLKRAARRSGEVFRQEGVGAVVTKGARLIGRNLYERVAFPQLVNELSDVGPERSDEELIQFARQRFRGLIAPLQKTQEIRTLMGRLRDLQPRNCLEIGTAKGGNLFLFARRIHPEARIFSIDLEGGNFGGGYPAWKQGYYQSLALPRQHLELIRGDSHRISTRDILEERLGDEQLDFLFIDGDHTYAGVRQDFEMYSSLVRPGGLIAFHDILPHPRSPDCQVDRFWNEIKQRYPSEEFVENPNQGKMGIGVLTLPVHS